LTRRPVVARRVGIIGALVALVVGATCGVVLAVSSAAATGRHVHVNVSVPSVLDVAGGRLWLANTGTGSMLEFNASNGTELLSVAGKKFQLYNSDGVAVIGGQVWVANAASDSITILDASNGHLVQLLSGTKLDFGSPLGLAVAGDRVFVLGRGGSTVVEFEARTATFVRAINGKGYHLEHASVITAVGDDVWVLSSSGLGSLTELDGTDGNLVRVVTATAADLDDATALGPIGHDLWIANAAGSHLSLLDAANGRLVSTLRDPRVDLNDVTSVVALSNGRLWIASTTAPSWVACLRSNTGGIVRVLRHRFGFPTLFAGAGRVWVVDRTQSRVTELNGATGAVVRVLVN
jgi:DNA-binding beta-propeller fold protein YncE